MNAELEGKLAELYVFAAQDEQGNEDVLAIELDGEWTPLICTSPEHASRLSRLAEQIVARMAEQSGSPRRLRLMRFSAPEDVTERFMHPPLSDELVDRWEARHPLDIFSEHAAPGHG